MQRVCGMATHSNSTCSNSKDDLVQNVYAYITEGTYPGGATANEKRVIRRKAKNFEVSCCTRTGLGEEDGIR